MNHTAEIKAVKETKEGTWMKIFVPDSFLEHDIERYKVGKKLYAGLSIDDGRRISREQNAKFHATIEDIAEFLGEPPQLTKDFIKYIWCYNNQREDISLSGCSMTEAKGLITTAIDFAIEEGVPLKELGSLRAEDIDKFLYKCLITKTCVITGRKECVDIHHCVGSRVGMGGNRKKIDNRGRELIALSREWHTKVHQEGEEEIFSKYKIYGLAIDDIGLKKLKLSTKDIT